MALLWLAMSYELAEINHELRCCGYHHVLAGYNNSNNNNKIRRYLAQGARDFHESRVKVGSNG